MQSHVSTLVAGLVVRGLLRTGTDPDDRRRTLVYPDAPLVRGIQRRRRPIDHTLAAELGDAEKAEEAAELLDRLAALLATGRSPTRAPDVTPATGPPREIS